MLSKIIVFKINFFNNKNQNHSMVIEIINIEYFLIFQFELKNIITLFNLII